MRSPVSLLREDYVFPGWSASGWMPGMVGLFLACCSVEAQVVSDPLVPAAARKARLIEARLQEPREVLLPALEMFARPEEAPAARALRRATDRARIGRRLVETGQYAKALEYAGLCLAELEAGRATLEASDRGQREAAAFLRRYVQERILFGSATDGPLREMNFTHSPNDAGVDAPESTAFGGASDAVAGAAEGPPMGWPGAPPPAGQMAISQDMAGRWTLTYQQGVSGSFRVERSADLVQWETVYEGSEQASTVQLLPDFQEQGSCFYRVRRVSSVTEGPEAPTVNQSNSTR